MKAHEQVRIHFVYIMCNFIFNLKFQNWGKLYSEIWKLNFE